MKYLIDDFSKNIFRASKNSLIKNISNINTFAPIFRICLVIILENISNIFKT